MSSASPSQTRIAVIGMGSIGPRHAEVVRNNGQAILVAIVDSDPTSEAFAVKLGVARYASVTDLIHSDHRPDGAIICTPNHTHAPIAKELSSAGIHVMIEKPLSADIASGKDLVEHFRNTKVEALVGHHRRFNPYMVATKKILDGGALGKIIAVNGLWTAYKPPEYFAAPSEWRRCSTGGVVLINMVHEIDLLHYLFGAITTVHAETIPSQRGFEAEEGAALTLRFRSGMVGTFLISDHTPSPYNFESGTGENPMIPQTGQDTYRIFGTEASLSAPDMSLWSYKDADKTWHSDLVREAIKVAAAVPFDLQLTHFCKVIRQEETPNCTSQAGLAALIVCQGIKEAMAGNLTVTLEQYQL